MLSRPSYFHSISKKLLAYNLQDDCVFKILIHVCNIHASDILLQHYFSPHSTHLESDTYITVDTPSYVYGFSLFTTHTLL